MDEEYDVVVMGTGLTECVISGLLSTHQKKVLHMDRNDYYGGDCASLNLKQMFEQWRPGKDVPESFGPSRDYNVDLVPKLIMAAGNLVKVLLKTRVTRYLEFKSVMGSFVYRGGKVYKVPTTASDALSSKLMGIFEKRRCKNFFEYVQDFDEANPKTFKGFVPDQHTMRDVYKYFGLDQNTQEFIGHAMALYSDDDYLDKACLETIKRIQLYAESLLRYGNSPYIYPNYGLGELPQAFSRLSAVYGGTYMLAKKPDKIVYDDSGKVCGVESEGQTVKCKMVVCDPSYAPEKCVKTGQVIRCICILSHPVPNTGDCGSCQIIIPQRQVNRKNDIYVMCLDSRNNVCPKGKYLAIVSTQVETDKPQDEIKVALGLLGQIDDCYFKVSNSFKPMSDGSKDGVFISHSYDGASHFETTTDDITDMWKRLNGSPLDLSVLPSQDEDDE